MARSLNRAIRVLLVLATGLAWLPAAQALETGVYPGRVRFGQSAAFSGPAQDLGNSLRLGIRAAFHEANEAGGVHRRRIELVSHDDAYEPEAAIANTHRLIRRDRVFALIGAVGTPTSRSAVPIAAAAGVPYIAPFTGAQFLRDPSLENVINLRASYYQETEEIVERLVRDLGVSRIGVFYQNDSFGRAGFQGVRLALERRGMELVATGVYPRNSRAVKSAILQLRSGNPEAVVLVGAYQPVAHMIAWSRHIGFSPLFLTISFVGSNALVRELGPDGVGVYVSQVVSSPGADTPPVAVEYRQALRALDPDAVPDFVSFEGYLAGRMAILALETCGRQLTRACFLNSLYEAGDLDLGGFRLRFGDGDNQGSTAVFLTMIDEAGEFRQVDALRAGPVR